jgi:predicted DNA-binding transcriptional regulator AlpA
MTPSQKPFEAPGPVEFTITIALDGAMVGNLWTRLGEELVRAVQIAVTPAHSGSPTFQSSHTRAAKAPDPLMWTGKEVAKALQVSERHLWRLAQAGQIPPPVRLGHLVRWSADVIRAWITAGCPASE